jgi:hypothetical protein
MALALRSHRNIGMLKWLNGLVRFDVSRRNAFRHDAIFPIN